MRGLGVAATVAAMLFVGGCKKAPDFGLAVAVTIDASMVPSATRASIRNLQINASGAESFTGTLALPNGLKATERTVYRPQASSGSLTIALVAIEGSSKPAAAGMATVALVAGKTVEMTIVLTTNVPAVDMAGGADMGGTDLGPADLGGTVDSALALDMTQAADLLPPAPIPFPPAAAWVGAGGPATGASTRVGISIGGSSPSGKSAAASGSSVTFGFFSSSNK